MGAEIQSINSEGAISVKRANLETIRVGVHILRMTSDLQALLKFPGHLGPSARQPCLCCDVPSVLLRSSNRYYLPSIIREEIAGTRSRRRTFHTKRLFDPSNVSLRSKAITKRYLRRLSSFSISEREQKSIMRKTGLNLRHLLRTDGCPDGDTCVISSASWTMIDNEIDRLAETSRYALFGPPPRKCGHIGSWKASECRQFVLSY